MVDLGSLGHVQPGAIPECLLQKWQQSALEEDISDFLGGLPFSGAQKVAANVDQGLDLLVPLLGILEVRAHIEDLALLARVAHSFALLPLSVLLRLQLLGFSFVAICLFLTGTCFLFLLFEGSWLLAADYRESL